MLKPGKKKGFALLLDASDKDPKGPPSSKRTNDAAKPPDAGDEPEDDLSDLDDMGDLDDELPGDDDPDASDPLAASADDGGDPSQIDPEVAGLAARLGFHQPHEQQALIDLIQLVTGPGGAGGPSSASPSPSPLPESSY